MYTSLLIQMSHGLARTAVPAWTSSPRAWRRSWMLGFCTAVIGRVKAAELKAAEDVASAPVSEGGRSDALVLASRDQVTAGRTKAAYPTTRKSRTTYSGSGYGDGYGKGSRADIGATRLSRQARGSLR